jgi:transposase-like protein
MGIDCPKCSKGNLVFYDGAFEHEPIWVCNNCGYKTINPDAKPRKKR